MTDDTQLTIDPGVSNLARHYRQLQVGRLCNEQLKVGVQGGHLDICIREVPGCDVEKVDHLHVIHAEHVRALFEPHA